MKKFLAVLVVLVLPAFAAAQQVTQEQVEDLKPLQQQCKVIDRLQADGTLNQEQADHYRQSNLQLAAIVAGQPVPTTATLDELIQKNDTSRFWGFFTFVNVLKVFGGIILAIALICLGVVYIGPLIIHTPVGFWEFACYVFVIFGMFSGAIWPGLGIWFVFPACLLLIAALNFTRYLHFKPSGAYHEPETDLKAGRGVVWFNFAQFTAAVCLLAWGVATFYYQSYLLGFMTVLALDALLGFSVIVWPGCVGMGFEQDDNVPRGTVASFVILVVYLITELTGGFLPHVVDRHEVVSPLIYFRTGALFMGSFVYFLGLLILSSRYYNAKRGNYILLQILTIVSGIAAFYIGATFGINTLLGIGGTFFVIYLLEKYAELPWQKIGFAWGLLGLAGIIYGAAYFAGKYPEYFLLGLR